MFRTGFGQEIPRYLDDLLWVASFVYMADRGVLRYTPKDVFADRWCRGFRMVVPVWDLALWQDPKVQLALDETLRFLTGDEWSFEFVQRAEGEPIQKVLHFHEPIHPLPRADVVILFSGGADSLAAVLEAVQQGHRPVLVSHRAAPVVDARQRNLVGLIRKRYPAWDFPHISMWVNRKGGPRTKEQSQRSRSFLFASLGVVTAAMLGLDDVRLCDNGVVSINLPQSGQNVGTFLTRSTHPRHLELLQEFARILTGRAGLTIRNTFIYKTRREVFEDIRASGHPELLQETVSCAHLEAMTKQQPHCGVCSQCIDRRFASIAAEMQMYDLAKRYEKDIFIGPLGEGVERTHAENYVRFARLLEELPNADAFFKQFPELYDCLPTDGNPDWHGEQLWSLFQRHQQNVNGVLDLMIGHHAALIRRGTLPPTSLLGLMGRGQHVVDPRDRCAHRLRDLLCSALPSAFQTEEARSERHVQDVGEAVFQGAMETLYRETPQLPFGAVTTKADFSDLPTDGAKPLFLEFKYVRGRDRLNGIQTEMTSRVLVYRQQGACVLFIVYDPNAAITNIGQFTVDFECHEGVWVGVAR
ncbi:MAG: hypothetical protein HY320_03730 [Armatimonadetes bacterium]|nr:hypothetical protein [Armatimonadota bacterium]